MRGVPSTPLQLILLHTAAVDSLPPSSLSGSVLQRSNVARGLGQGGDSAVAIDMDHMDSAPLMSNDMSQMQLVEQQVRNDDHNIG